ncbi:hypothetical protein J2T05_002045 [Cupriavidus necator]|nr:hypothetical protein [Cupriavidus necator]
MVKPTKETALTTLTALTALRVAERAHQDGVLHRIHVPAPLK